MFSSHIDLAARREERAALEAAVAEELAGPPRVPHGEPLPSTPVVPWSTAALAGVAVRPRSDLRAKVRCFWTPGSGLQLRT